MRIFWTKTWGVDRGERVYFTIAEAVERSANYANVEGELERLFYDVDSLRKLCGIMAQKLVDGGLMTPLDLKSILSPDLEIEE